MARIRSRRRPFTAPRQGRLKDAIRFAFVMSRANHLRPHNWSIDATRLFGSSATIRVGIGRMCAGPLAVPVGRSHKRGRPILWAPRDPIRETPFDGLFNRL
jgi:hypothetical protein